MGLGHAHVRADQCVDHRANHPLIQLGALELDQASTLDQRLDDPLLGVTEPELRQILDRLGFDLEPATELAELGVESPLGEVLLRAEVDDGADVELAARDGRQRDRIVDDEIAALERERPGRALGDHAAAQPHFLVGREPSGLGEDLDLFTVRRRGLFADDVRDLGRGYEVSRERNSDRSIGLQRGRCSDDDPLVERDDVGLTVREHGDLAGEPARGERRQGLAPRPIEHRSSG